MTSVNMSLWIACAIIWCIATGDFAAGYTSAYVPCETRCMLPQQSQSGSNPRVREDYTLSPGIGAHKFHNHPLTWNEARKTCSVEGGHLAVINSVAELQVLQDLFSKAGPISGASRSDEAFVGIHDMYKHGEWATILGEPLAHTGYEVWANHRGNQPNNLHGKQHCGVLFKGDTLNDCECDSSLAFFCELPIVSGLFLCEIEGTDGRKA